MGDVAGRRMMAEIDGDFVVFLIGARFNSKLQSRAPSSTSEAGAAWAGAEA
jgi:hypothetical protein